MMHSRKVDLYLDAEEAANKGNLEDSLRVFLEAEDLPINALMLRHTMQVRDDAILAMQAEAGRQQDLVDRSEWHEAQREELLERLEGLVVRYREEEAAERRRRRSPKDSD